MNLPISAANRSEATQSINGLEDSRLLVELAIAELERIPAQPVEVRRAIAALAAASSQSECHLENLRRLLRG